MYAAAQLENWGYRAERQAVLFAPPVRVNLLEPVVSAVLLLASAVAAKVDLDSVAVVADKVAAVVVEGWVHSVNL